MSASVHSFTSASIVFFGSVLFLLISCYKNMKIVSLGSLRLLSDQNTEVVRNGGAASPGRKHTLSRKAKQVKSSSFGPHQKQLLSSLLFPFTACSESSLSLHILPPCVTQKKISFVSSSERMSRKNRDQARRGKIDLDAAEVTETVHYRYLETRTQQTIFEIEMQLPSDYDPNYRWGGSSDDENISGYYSPGTAAY
ncbi:hypothetical protein BHE74_00015910 [Ensete ventricosum]|nr:hypothetical protein BHE74_00015910 [Ensete ventricosum]